MVIAVDGERYLAHRLAWLYVHGECPPEIDHEDTIKKHNWMSNLRPATDGQNASNRGVRSDNVLGLKGICWNKNYKKYVVQVQAGGKRVVKRFVDIEAAVAFRDRALSEFHGRFARVA